MDDPRRARLRAAFGAATRVAGLVALVLAGAYVGLLDGRGIYARVALGSVGQLFHALAGLLVSGILVRLAIRQPARPLITIVLVAGWASWLAGNAVAVAQGPSYTYAGTAQLSRGGQVDGSYGVQCVPVIGEATTLAAVTAASDFDLQLRGQIERQVYSWVTFDTTSPVVLAAAAGLDGSATLADGSVLAWHCDPATRAPA